MPKKAESSKEPSIAKLSTKSDEQFISFGIPELDKLTGGIPRGRITEIWGAEKIGKTHTLGMVMAANTELDILFVDAEFALNRSRMASFGANTEKVDFIQDARLERVSELILASVGKYDIIMLDSLSFLTPATVDAAEVGENAIGLFSRLIKHFAIKLRPRLGVSKTAVVVVNQYRKPFGLYAKAEPVGGTAWHHAVDLRIQLTANSNDKIMQGTTRIGHWVNAEAVKSKVSQPYQKAKYKLIYKEES